MEQNRKMPVPGEFYRHFKNRIYQVIAVAHHSETGEKMVVYQALYGDFKVWVRPLSMFMEEVDPSRYPEAEQKFRFERIRMEREEAQSDGRDGQGSGPEPRTGAGSEPEPEAMNPFLLDFFDAMDERNYDRMLEALAKLAPKAGRKELDDIAMVLDLDMRSMDGESAGQLAEIRRHILRLKKFDGERLR